MRLRQHFALPSFSRGRGVCCGAQPCLAFLICSPGSTTKLRTWYFEPGTSNLVLRTWYFEPDTSNPPAKPRLAHLRQPQEFSVTAATFRKNSPIMTDANC